MDANLASTSGTPESLGTARMDPAIKAKWVAALRSGEYKQGLGELRNEDNHFCCLGVLCNLQGPDGWQPLEDGGSYFYQHGDADFELPPRSLRAVWGFDWEKVEVEIGGKVARLYDHNDAGRTFAEIADAIEAQL